MRVIRCILLIIGVNWSFSLFSQGPDKDSRTVYFFLFKKDLSAGERVAKTLSKSSDTSLFSEIKLLVERAKGSVDTLNCAYTNNHIYFQKIDTLNEKVTSIKIAFNITKTNRTHKSKLIIPFTNFFKNTDRESTMAVSVENKSGNQFHVTISKIDFPFIVISMDVRSS